MTEKQLRRSIRQFLLKESPDDLIKALDAFGAKDTTGWSKDASEWLETNYSLDNDAKGKMVNQFRTSFDKLSKLSKLVKNPEEGKFFDGQTGEALISPEKFKKKSEEAQATPNDIDEDMEEIEGGMAEFEATLEKTIEKAYKAEDTPEYKEMAKNLNKIEKYGLFFQKLIDMIMNYAKKKERQDVVDLTQGNLQVVQTWMANRMELLQDQMKQEFGEDIVKVAEPTQKQMGVVNKIFSAILNDFKKIIMTLKKDPLKKLNKDNLLESVRRDRRNFLMERKLRKQVRRIIRNRR